MINQYLSLPASEEQAPLYHKHSQREMMSRLMPLRLPCPVLNITSNSTACKKISKSPKLLPMVIVLWNASHSKPVAFYVSQSTTTGSRKITLLTTLPDTLNAHYTPADHTPTSCHCL